MPVPWSGDAPPYGYGGEPWLPQPADWGPLTVEAQQPDPTSMLNLYRTALRIRHDKLGDGTIRWIPLGDDVLAFSRESGLTCVVNLGAEPVHLPEHQQVCLASGPVDGGLLPTDTAVWLL